MLESYKMNTSRTLMTNFIIYIGLTCAIFVLSARTAPAQEKAQEKIDPCQLIAEEIIPLRVPNFEQSAMWKKTSGVKGSDRPRALLNVIDGGQILIGSSIPYDEKTGLASPQVQMVRTDKNGKIIVERWIDVKNLKTVADAVLLKDKVVVLSQLGSDKDDTIGLNFLNGAGQERSARVISDPHLRLIPKSMMAAVGGTQIIIAAEAISRKNPKDSYSVLIWVDKDGKKIAQKEYLPGVVNKPEYVGRLDNGEIVMTGRVRNEHGNDAGWVVRLNAKGEIIYQRPYARGEHSVIRRAVSLRDGHMVVVGDALPAATGDKAAWIMKLDASGQPVWQKYLTGQYGYSGLDIILFDDSRLNVLIAGQPTTEGGRQFARLITLSTHGVVIGDESFIEGSNAIPARLISQGKYRFLLGLAETGFSKEGMPEDMKFIAYDSWIMGLPSLPVFFDTCSGTPNRTVDDLP